MQSTLYAGVVINRREFAGRLSGIVSSAALASLLSKDGLAGATQEKNALPGLPHLAARANRVIYLFQSGGPSQIDLFDEKPSLAAQQGVELPDSIRQGQRLTGMTATQASFHIAGGAKAGLT